MPQPLVATSLLLVRSEVQHSPHQLQAGKADGHMHGAGGAGGGGGGCTVHTWRMGGQCVGAGREEGVKGLVAAPASLCCMSLAVFWQYEAERTPSW